MKYTCLVPVYGSNRMLGEHVGRLLKGCEHVSIGCAGGLSELPYIDARTVLVNDLNRHAINLAMCIADEGVKSVIVHRLGDMLFHPDVLDAAQSRCRAREEKGCKPWVTNIDWAVDYFVCSWMARNGKAGTKDEFDAGLSFRWESGGGDSAVRFRNATESLHAWHKLCRRCTFTCMDVCDFIAKVHDKPKHGLYLDPDWPDDGAAYRHHVGDNAGGGDKGHRRLAEAVRRFEHTRVVIRYGDHPLIRELYPEDRGARTDDEAAELGYGAPDDPASGFVPGWTWHRLTGRTAANKDKAEVLIVNK